MYGMGEKNEREGETNHKRLLRIENRLKVDGGRWMGMGIEEGPCCDGHWVLYVSDESLNLLLKLNIALYVNQLELK